MTEIQPYSQRLPNQIPAASTEVRRLRTPDGSPVWVGHQGPLLLALQHALDRQQIGGHGELQPYRGQYAVRVRLRPAAANSTPRNGDRLPAPRWVMPTIAISVAVLAVAVLLLAIGQIIAAALPALIVAVVAFALLRFRLARAGRGTATAVGGGNITINRSRVRINR